MKCETPARSSRSSLEPAPIQNPSATDRRCVYSVTTRWRNPARKARTSARTDRTRAVPLGSYAFLAAPWFQLRLLSVTLGVVAHDSPLGRGPLKLRFKGRPPLRRQALVLSATLVALLALGGGRGMGALPTGFQETVVFSGLTNPSAIGSSLRMRRVFVAEKGGRIKVFDGLMDSSPDVFADLSANVQLLGSRDARVRARSRLHQQAAVCACPLHLRCGDRRVAADVGDGCPNPPGATGGWVCGQWPPLAADGVGNFMTGAEQVLINDWCQQYPSHSIGALGFGADGALYVSGGDGASFNFTDWGQDGSPLNPCGDPPGGIGAALSPPSAEGGALRSQDLRTSSDPATLDGAILRVNPDTGQALPTNPNAASGDANARRIVAYGLRNPFRSRSGRGRARSGWAMSAGRAGRRSTGSPTRWGRWRTSAGPATRATAGSPATTTPASASARTCTLPGGVVATPYYTYNHSAQVVAGESVPDRELLDRRAGLLHRRAVSRQLRRCAVFRRLLARLHLGDVPGRNGLPNASNRATFQEPAANPSISRSAPTGRSTTPTSTAARSAGSRTT